MDKKIGRNDPCYCGSGKKYKQCCLKNDKPGGKRKIKAKLISGGSVPKKQPPDLMMRTFGNAIQKAENKGLPSTEKKDENNEKTS